MIPALIQRLDEAIAEQVQARVTQGAFATASDTRRLAEQIDPLHEVVERLRWTLIELQQTQQHLQKQRDLPTAQDEQTLQQIRLTARDEALQDHFNRIRDRLRSIADVVGGSDRRVRSALEIAQEARDLAERAQELLSRSSIPAAPSPPKETAADTQAGTCRVPGCDRPAKARGLCSRHYGQWYRGRLDGWVQANGVVRFSDGSRWRVSADLASEPATLEGGAVRVNGEWVEAHPAR